MANLVKVIHIGPRGAKGETGASGSTGPSGSTAWITSGSNIYYTAGSIGIGTATPSTELEVLGDTLLTGNVDTTKTWTTVGNTATDRLYSISSTVESDNAVATRYPRALFAVITTSGLHFGGSSEIYGLQGQFAAATNISINEGTALYGRNVSTTNNTQSTAIGMQAVLQVNAASTLTGTDVSALQADINIPGTVNSTNLHYLRLREVSLGTISGVTNFYGINIPSITGAVNNYSIKTGLGTASFGDKVGIGTTTPSELLQVSGGRAKFEFIRINSGRNPDYPTTGAGFEGIYDISGSAGSGDTGEGVSFFTSYDRDFSQYRDLWFNAADILIRSNPAQSGSGFIKFNTSATDTRLFITSSGNIGIGTILPTNLLHVAGTFKNESSVVGSHFTGSFTGSFAGTLTLPTFTDTSLLFVTSSGLIAQDNANLRYDDNLKSLRVGPTTNLSGFRLAFETASNTIILGNSADTKYSIFRQGNMYVTNTAGGASFVGETIGSYTNIFAFRANGTTGSKTAVVADDTLFRINASGYDSSSWSTEQNMITAFEVVATENFTSSAQGRKVKIRTVGNGTITGIDHTTFEDAGKLRLHQYGTGNKTAASASKTRSNYLSGYATDGTLLEVEAYGDYADDGNAATGSVPTGGVYFNTTNGKLHTRMI